MSKLEEKISFKVILNEQNVEPVFRRFDVNKNVELTLQFLRQKLIQIFGKRLSPGAVDFKLTWTDDEGDRISVTSDDELAISLGEMAAKVKKYSVEIFNHSDRLLSGKEPVLWDVICEGCRQSISGFRYKCVTCPTLELCVSCETAGLHSDHYMIR